MEDDNPAREEFAERPWPDLPSEIVSIFSDLLGLVDLIMFRAVCKNWRFASSASSAEIESAMDVKASFLLHEEHDKFNFYYGSSSKVDKWYTISIPELENADCLASLYGWLLIFRQSGFGGSNSMFFFCPLTGAKIDLPPFPRSDISEHFAVFSAPPTSPKCVVSVVNRCDETKVKLHILKRGGSGWTNMKDYDGGPVGKITYGFYDKAESTFNYIAYGTNGDLFNFFYGSGNFLKFSLKDEKWENHLIPSLNGSNSDLPTHLKDAYFSLTIAHMAGLPEEKPPVYLYLGPSQTPCPVVFYYSTLLGRNEIWFNPRRFFVPQAFSF